MKLFFFKCYTAIKANAKGVLDVDVAGVHSNIVMVQVVHPGLTPDALCRRLATVTVVILFFLATQ
jgi:hypothetical protein